VYYKKKESVSRTTGAAERDISVISLLEKILVEKLSVVLYFDK
jgi:hypothetical protein